jgi:hypothetical protein
MQSNVTEKDMRHWLRSVWSRGKGGVGVQWVEPTSGSSVGFPDALLPVWPALLPVELKLSKKTSSKYVASVRPVQRRFHTLMRANDMFSCFLLGVGDQKCFDIWLAHNSRVVWDHHDEPGEVLIASKQTVNATISRMQLISELLHLMNRHNQVLLQVPGDGL